MSLNLESPSLQGGENVNKLRISITVLTLLVTSQHVTAADPQWAWEAGKQTSNGAITLKSVSGGATYSGTQNPTGAVAKINQSAATQPPTVIIQATASLPIKAVGDACTSSTSGTAPNQSAGEGTAITADRTLILSCQSGIWAKGTGWATEYLLLLVNNQSGVTLSCPVSWTTVGGTQIIDAGQNYQNYGQLCQSPAGKTCSLIYFYNSYPSGVPFACPATFVQADLQTVFAGSNSNYRRTCYKCS